MDDYSPRPLAPSLDFVEQEDVEDLRDTRSVAEAYFHPSFAKLEERWLLEIAKCNIDSIPQDLPADEFKIEAVARARYANFLKTELGVIEDAVRAIESTKQGAK